MPDRPAVSAEFTPGRPRRLAPGVIRITAPNASVMTGPGTNSYVLGDPPVAILDPGPDSESHLAALMAVVPHPRWLFCTHTHRDHSPLAARIAAATGALCIGLPPPDDGRQDRSFVPDEVATDGRRFELGSAILEAIATPGHASNHVCYRLEELLFSGDHILDGVTPVILAPDGDMQAYLASLHRLRALPLSGIAPGHGRLLSHPETVIDDIVAHRARREARVLAALHSQGPSDLDRLLETVYAETDPRLWPMARLSLTAILIKLEREGHAMVDGATWVLR